jgi:hypothetical protein
MALEHRNGRVYYYTSRRIGGRVRRVYGGSGACAELAALLDDDARERRKQATVRIRLRIDAARDDNTKYRRWFAEAAGVIAEALVRAGWHLVRRQWRKRRGMTVNVPAQQVGELSWVASELSAQAGKLAEETREKANKQDKAALKVVDAFLDHPAARALWGDLGRHVLAQWADLYAGKNETMKRAVLRFASDLRSNLAGENPSALDVLLAERVVLAWLFANWSEYQYAGLAAGLSIKETELHLKRIEMANRNLLAAARTLAKVKRAKLPDLLALVNVNPPPARPLAAQS